MSRRPPAERPAGPPAEGDPGNHETVGAAIRARRLAEKLTPEAIAEKTKISARTLADLEENRFEKFPSEIYILGFITNLAEALKLDPAALVNLYRAQRGLPPAAAARPSQAPRPPRAPKPTAIPQEPASVPRPSIAVAPAKSSIPTPVAAAGAAAPSTPGVPFGLPFLDLANLFKNRVMFGAAVVVGVLVLVLGCYALYGFIHGREARTIINPETSEARVVTPYKLYKDSGSFDLRKGDQVDIFYNGSIVKFQLASVRATGADFSIGSLQRSLEQDAPPLALDIDSDSTDDIEVKLKRISGDLAYFNFRIINLSNTVVDYQQIWDRQTKLKVGREYELFRDQERQPIVVYVKALSGASYLQWNVDGKRQNTKTLEVGSYTEITADMHLEIGIGNFNHVMLIVNKIPIDLSLDREKLSVTKIIKWTPTAENETRFNLVIEDYAK